MDESILIKQLLEICNAGEVSIVVILIYIYKSINLNMTQIKNTLDDVMQTQKTLINKYDKHDLVIAEHDRAITNHEIRIGAIEKIKEGKGR